MTASIEVEDRRSRDSSQANCAAGESQAPAGRFGGRHGFATASSLPPRLARDLAGARFLANRLPMQPTRPAPMSGGWRSRSTAMPSLVLALTALGLQAPTSKIWAYQSKRSEDHSPAQRPDKRAAAGASA